MLLKYNASKIDFVNTSEAYSKKLYVGRNSILIPYINIGLESNNPINSKQSVIDYSYYFLYGVYKTSFSIIEDKLEWREKDGGRDFIKEYIMIGGYKSIRLKELEVLCRERYLYFADTAVISSYLEPFIPNPTPSFNQNLSTQEIERFFSALPVELEMALGPDYCSVF